MVRMVGTVLRPNKKYKKKPVVVEASQWFKAGDHEKVVKKTLKLEDFGRRCEHCGKRIEHHGFINTLEGGHIVCPGDWVIKGIQGEFYPCKNEIFKASYDAVPDTMDKTKG